MCCEGLIEGGLFILISQEIGIILVDKMALWGIFQVPIGKYNIHCELIL